MRITAWIKHFFTESPGLPVKCMGEAILCAHMLNQETIDRSLERPWAKLAIGDSVVEGKQHAQATLDGKWYRLRGCAGSLRVEEAGMDTAFLNVKVQHEIRPWVFWRKR